MKIVLFEDTEEQATGLLAALKKVSGGSEIVHFKSESEEAGTFENRLAQILRDGPFANATLVVADRDLSKTTGLIGLSESSVRRAADSLGIPECSYQRNDQAAGAPAVEQREACIAVSIAHGFENCAAQIIAVENGFAAIRGDLPTQLEKKGKKSPGHLLAGILGKPEYAEKISLYASGDQNRLVDVLRISKSKGDSQLAQITCHLGYWLWDSVLRFPGVVLNSVTAASYLNILEAQFTGEVQAVFDGARYAGPFAGASGELWWRGMLDDLISSEKKADGRELASSRLGRDIEVSQCCEDASQPAGYYCMLSNRPVSLANSHPGLPWFPRGADLARVSRSQYEELGPWL